MDQDFDKEMDDLRKERGENVKRNWEKTKTRLSRSPSALNPQGRYLVLSAIGVFALVIILVLFSGGDDQVPVKDLNTIKAKLGELEKRLANLESTGQKAAQLEGQLNRLERSISKLTRSVPSKAEKRRYHEVRQGETLSRIAQKYGIPVEKLCRLNKITPKTVIRPGQKLLVSSGG